MPFSHPIEVRFRDLDPFGHVNHAAVLTFLEVARLAWWRGFLAGRPFGEAGFLIARVEVDYRKPILLEDAVRVELRCTQAGTSSFALAYQVLRGDGVVLVEAQSVQVLYDFRAGRPRPVPPELAAWLRGQA